MALNVNYYHEIGGSLVGGQNDYFGHLVFQLAMFKRKRHIINENQPCLENNPFFGNPVTI